ncbi:MAG: flagellar export protein FliJ [Candidatus Caenarcaniphilales bacterium]|nr:flagellar export protein FliJ [Candidatus Caenarcaniphilales bacterium]
MKKFKFRLDAVLKYKKILKDKQLAQYNKALGAYKDVENKINDLEQQQENVYSSMVQNAQDGFSLIQHQGKEIVNQKLHHEMNVEKVRLAKRKKLVQVEQKKLVGYAKDEKGIEILKENALEEYKQELLAEEIKEIDDIVSTRFRVNDN